MYAIGLVEKKEHIKPDQWKLVLCAETWPQQKNKVNCGAFVCMYCYYKSHDSCLNFDDSIIAKFQKTIALLILNGKELVIGVTLLKVLKFIPLLQGQVNLLPLETSLKVLLNFFKSRLITNNFKKYYWKWILCCQTARQTTQKYLRTFARIC